MEVHTFNPRLSCFSFGYGLDGDIADELDRLGLTVISGTVPLTGCGARVRC
jgi:hypothetical protein